MAGEIEGLDDASLASWSTFGVDVSDPEGFRQQLAAGSFPVAIAARSRERGDHLALRIGSDAVSYAELDAETARAAGWLQRQGVGPGDRVVLCGANSIELVIAWLGVVRLRAVTVVLNPTLSPRELAFLVQDSGCSAVCADEDLLPKFQSLDEMRQVPSLEALRAVSASAVGIREVSRDATPIAVAPLPSSTLCTLQYTSGTTGQPKGVMLTHGNLLASLRCAIIAWRWSQEDVLVHSLPMSHGHGFNGVLTALLTGATAIVLPRTDPERICRTIAESGATIFYSVPAIWERLLTWEGFDRRYFHSLRLFTSGSAPLSPALSDRVKDMLGERPLERYGATETGFAVTNPIDGPRIAGSVGKPFPGAEVRVVDADGRGVPPGEDGEIVVRGPAVFAGYWRIEDHDPYFYPGGWFRTGDVGRFDPANGYLSITGRLKDMIISGGLNVYPREVELIAEQFPGVKEAAATGVPSEAWGEEVVLGVVGEPNLDLSALTVHLRENLAGYKVPKQIKLIEAVQRNQMGKVLRSELTRQWADLP